MISAIAGLLLPIAAAWLALVASRVRRADEGRLLTAALAVCCGLGLASVSTFFLMMAGLPLGGAFVAVDAAIWIAIGLAATIGLRRYPAPEASRRAPIAHPTAYDWLARVGFAVVAAIVVGSLLAHYAASPHGEWDAWAIWNQKARFMFRAGRGWTASLAIAWSNPSHPLFVSLSVARLWGYAGAELTAVPALLGAVYAAATAAAVVGALDARRSQAWIAGAVLIAPATFALLAAAQTADLPLALFIVATLAMWREGEMQAAPGSAEERRDVLLTGLLSSLAAWVKNEGLVFLGVMLLLVAWRTVRARRPVLLLEWAAGATPVTLTFIWLKRVIAPVAAPYFADAAGHSMLSPVLDPQRHQAVLGVIEHMFPLWGGPGASGALLLVLLAVLAALWRTPRAAWPPVAACAIMLASYYAVWVLSPLDPQWLVSTTFDRLFLQLWPTLLVVAFAPRLSAAPTPVQK
jgi:hypothetical protein